MKAIYIEAFAGISGNMLLGALIDAGVPFDHLASEMKKLHLGEYELINERVHGGDAQVLQTLSPDGNAERNRNDVHGYALYHHVRDDGDQREYVHADIQL